MEKEAKRIKFPCFGTKCQICGWAPWKNHANKLCQDYRHSRPFVDIKPFLYKPDGRRAWVFGSKEAISICFKEKILK